MSTRSSLVLVTTWRLKEGGGGIKTDVDFPLFLIKHDTVTINNHALCYTAEACFQGNQVGEKVSIQMEKLRWTALPFNAVPSCNIVHSESTKEGLHFFVLSSSFNHKK